jgi:hypothetical protein
MGIVITRTAFCPICEQESRPWKGILFLVYGSCRDGYYVRKAIRGGIRGYTPHLFILKSVIGSNCEVETVCCIHGCCVKYRYSKESHSMVYGVIPDKWGTQLMPITDWNALVLNKRDSQFYI